MREPPVTVAVAVGPGRRPDGWADVLEQHARALDAGLDRVEADSEAALVAALEDAADRCQAVVLSANDLSDPPSLAAAIEAVRVPVVWADAAAIDARTSVHRACDRVVHGRGRRSFGGALRWAVNRVRHGGTTLSYGDHDAQVGELRMPARTDPAPVVVLLHGGFWLDPWERDLMDGLAIALTAQGWATWNVEYRRLGPTEGGWPGTWADACAAVAAVADLAGDHRVDPGRVVLLGHSAGASLAAYVVARERLPGDAPGEPPGRRPAGLVCLAGLLDLAAGAAAGLGGGAVTACLGDHEQAAATYALASPDRLVPLATPTLLVHGRDDAFVPARHSQAMAAAAEAAGDPVELRLVDSDHFAIIDPDGPAAGIVADWLAAALGHGSA